MASKMKAVVFHGKSDLRYEEVQVPAVKDGQVKVCLGRRMVNRIVDIYAKDSAIMVRNMRDW